MGHLNILRKASLQNKHSLVSSYAKMENNSEIQLLVDGVYESPNTDMGSHWMSFIKMSGILLQNAHACHVGNFDEYLSSIHDMLSGLLAYNNHNYGKMLADYWAMLSSLPDDVRDYFRANISLNPQLVCYIPVSQLISGLKLP